VTSGGQALISIAKETPETFEYYVTAVPTPFIYREIPTIPSIYSKLIYTSYYFNKTRIEADTKN